MSKITNNNKIMEHRTEYHSAPNSKPKRIRKKTTIQDIQTNIEHIVIQFNCAALVGIAALWVAPSMAAVPVEIKLGLSALYLISGLSSWTDKEE